MNYVPLNIPPKPLLGHFLNEPAQEGSNPACNAQVYLHETLYSLEEELSELNLIMAQGGDKIPGNVLSTLQHEQAELTRLYGAVHDLAMEMRSFCHHDADTNKEKLRHIYDLCRQVFGRQDRRARDIGRMAAYTVSSRNPEDASQMQVPVEQSSMFSYHQMMEDHVQNISLGTQEFRKFLCTPRKILSVTDAYNQLVGEEMNSLIQISSQLLPGQQEQVQTLALAEQALEEALRRKELDMPEIENNLKALESSLLEFHQALESISALLPLAQDPPPMNSSVFHTAQERERALNEAYPGLHARFNGLAKNLGLPLGEQLSHG